MPPLCCKGGRSQAACFDAQARKCVARGCRSIETRPGIAARKFPAKGKINEARCGRHAERGTCTYPVAAYGLSGVRRRSNCTSRRSCKGPREDNLFLRPHVSGRHRSCSTVGLGSSSAGGALGTTSMSGAGTTLRVFGKRVGIAATPAHIQKLSINSSRQSLN